MSRLLLIALVFLTGCLSTDPAQWRGEARSFAVDAEACRLKANDEALPYYVWIGPITGSITRTTVYDKCMEKRGWTKVVAP